MLTLLLFIFPIVAAIPLLFLNAQREAKWWAFTVCAIEVFFTGFAFRQFKIVGPSAFLVNFSWISPLGIQFQMGMDALSLLMVILTSTICLMIVYASFRSVQDHSNWFFALILTVESALMGVFCARDAFLFYIFWELTLIPIFFLMIYWKKSKTPISVFLKFIVYSIGGSLLMLAAFLWLYTLTMNPHHFSFDAFFSANLGAAQDWIFWMLMVAFAIKLPLFPFHTWQPDAYAESPMPVTMILGALMSKMGLYGMLRFFPLFTYSVGQWSKLIIACAVVTVLYASSIALVQKEMKRLLAYLSMAHLALIVAGIFSVTSQGFHGSLIQIVSHSVNTVGLFLVAQLFLKWSGTTELNQVGGFKNKSRFLSTTFFVIVLGSIALPLTNGFIGEFLLLWGIVSSHVILGTLASLSMVISAWVMLNLYQKTMLTPSGRVTVDIQEASISLNEKIILSVIVGLIFFIGIFPKPILKFADLAAKQSVFAGFDME